ncbi:ATP-dependent RNA helicase ded1 [Symbiodinium microadriaticum]|uniref:RNA helicase n=1 Tax=Symbiodinium microadriaticum TaxID=2951 RepID=A0A1Q9C9U5_SYMMI|nr:ATP-dependent RNA helicase ded1 [Symbiodinium microadriaticum]
MQIGGCDLALLRHGVPGGKFEDCKSTCVVDPEDPRGRARWSWSATEVHAPTRELAAQIAGEASWLVAGTSINVAAIYGGVHLGGTLEYAPYRDTRDALSQGADLLVATPGRLEDACVRGETLLEADIPEPVTGQQIIERLPGPTTRFDRLLRDSESLDLSAELRVTEEAINLLFVRVDAGLLAGLEADTVEALNNFGAIQDAPPGFPGMKCCLNLAKEDKTFFSGGGYGGMESTHHVLLLPDGRILAKYHHESDYMERSRGYSCTCCWEIAEGNFSPTEEPGCLRVTWTGWAELRHRSDEPFDPGTIAANWEPKELDADRHRLPSTLVPTEKGMLNLQSLCLAWADEDAGDLLLRDVRAAVLDEADRMLDLGQGLHLARRRCSAHFLRLRSSGGFEDQIRILLTRTAMFSATFGIGVQHLAADFLDAYTFVAVGRVGGAAQTVEQRVIWVEDARKALLGTLLALESAKGTSPCSVLVFANTKDAVRLIEEKVRAWRFRVFSIHGDKKQDAREKALQLFRHHAEGRSSGSRDSDAAVLVATDVAARGLDIPDITCVVHYDLPRRIDDFVPEALRAASEWHRSGRTGRLGRNGLSIAFANARAKGLSKELVKCLAEAGAKIPPWLLGMAISTGEDLGVLEVQTAAERREAQKLRSFAEELRWKDARAKSQGVGPCSMARIFCCRRCRSYEAHQLQTAVEIRLRP